MFCNSANLHFSEAVRLQTLCGMRGVAETSKGCYPQWALVLQGPALTIAKPRARTLTPPPPPLVLALVFSKTEESQQSIRTRRFVLRALALRCAGQAHAGLAPFGASPLVRIADEGNRCVRKFIQKQFLNSFPDTIENHSGSRMCFQTLLHFQFGSRMFVHIRMLFNNGLDTCFPTNLPTASYRGNKCWTQVSLTFESLANHFGACSAFQ